ncbi:MULTISPECIES: hypothetical protein [Limnospira]|uniref:hypothetical protein n=2 Tax=Sirenicapillariaceae TaxID=2934961 RepID=UPI0001C38A38|nr:hypothetical protein [Arthrospira platensis PCC 7345]MDT9312886.1 hypothetical protein [Limnospira sp. Paracas R14]
MGGLSSQLLMTIGRSLCRVAIYGGICFGASVLLPELALPVAFLSTDKGQDILTKVGEMISSVTAGNTANAIDNFDPRGSDHVPLENEDLIRVCGKAIAQIILLAAQQYNNRNFKDYNKKYSEHLQKIAAQATEKWVELARFEFAQSKYQQLTEGEIPLIITPTEEGLTQAEILTVEEWRNILAKLDLMAVDSAEGVDLPDYVRRYVAELLQKEFPRVLREALKQDFKADGKAFAGLMIQLITGIWQQVAQLGEIAPISLAKLNDIEQQLAGTQQQIQQLLIDISNRMMETGFEKLCHEFGLFETNINQNLQTIQESLNEINERTKRIDQSIQKLIQTLNLSEQSIKDKLLHLDYREQVRSLEDFLDQDRIVGAFWIYGSNQSEPHWLVTSLIENVLNVKIETSNTSSRVVSLSFVGNTQSHCLDNIIDSISKAFQIENPTVSKKGNIEQQLDNYEEYVMREKLTYIIEQICIRWQTKSVVILAEIKKGVDPEIVEEFINKLWKPLAKLAYELRQKHYNIYNYSLMLFLVDVHGCTNNWEINFTEDILSEQIPEIPIRLTEIQPIPREQLRQWFRTHLLNDPRLINNPILKHNKDQLIEKMLDLISYHNNIYQEKVFYQICKLFEIDINWI